MAQSIDKTVALLAQAARENLLLSVADLLDLLHHKSLFGAQIVALSTRRLDKGREIIPTLSAFKPAQGKPSPLQPAKQIYEIVEADPIARRDAPQTGHVEYVISAAVKAGFSVTAAESNESCVLCRGTVDESALVLLAEAVDIIRRNCLNSLNDSMALSLHDWEHLRPQLSGSIRRSATAFSEFVGRRYGVNCFPAFRASKNAWRIAGPTTQRRRIGLLLLSFDALLLEGKSFLIRRGRTYFLGMPFVGHSTGRYRRLLHALIIMSPRRLPNYLPDNLNRFVDLYFNQFLLDKRSDHLQSLYSRVLEVQRSPAASASLASRLSPINELRKFFLHAAAPVVEVTNAFSATLRLFDYRTGALRRIAEHSSPDVERQTPSTKSEYISLMSRKKSTALLRSVNVRAFLLGETIYLRQATAANTLYHRANTRSELCVPVFFRRTCIGTVNFESPITSGFDNDKAFVEAAVSHLSDYGSSLIGATDRFWLSRLTRLEHNVHELRNMIGKELDQLVPTKSVARIIRRRIRNIIDRQLITVSGKFEPLAGIRSVLDDFIADEIWRTASAVINEYREEEVHRSCKIRLHNPRLPIRTSRLDLIRVIYRNLISNIRRHGVWGNDIIEMRHNGRHSSPLTITAVSRQHLNDSTAQSITLRPIRRRRGGSSEGVGLFLVGVLTRELGGFAFVDNDPTASRFRVHLRIPIGDGDDRDQ